MSLKNNITIVKWLDKQHEWIQEAALRLLENGEISKEDIKDFVDLIKSPNPDGEKSRSFPVINPSSDFSEGLRIESIGPVTGIDVLNPKTPLEFGSENLAVVYGANGSGKSGYTRIIKKACGKPNSVDLKPNVYEGGSETQECQFSYQIAGSLKAVTWAATDDPVEDLRAVDVFDSECGRIYLEKETDFSYQPPELTLFGCLVDVCKKVEKILKAEQQLLVSSLPGIPAEHKDSKAGKFYLSLSSDTTDERVTELTTWTAIDKSGLKRGRDFLSVSDFSKAASGRRDEKLQIDSIRTGLQGGVDALAADSIREMKKLKESAEHLRRTAREAAQALGDSAKLEGVGSVTWKAMWEAARNYSKSEAYPERPFPNTEESAICLLCHQALDGAARRRLEGFESYVRGSLEREAVAAENKFETFLEGVPSKPAKEVLKMACLAAKLPEELSKDVESAWMVLEKNLEELRKGTIPESIPVIGAEVEGLLGKLKRMASSREEEAVGFIAASSNSGRIAANENTAELKGKKWVSEQANAVKAEVERLRKVARYDEWRKQTKTHGITREAGRLSAILITESYIQRFNDELRKLGASRIQVELVKTSNEFGKTKHGIRLKNAALSRVRTVEVLSEGERRIVALAAFLADVTGRGSTAPFVFDDPVSSLDQMFEEKVIARLIELSQERQVLVFTHRLSFLGIINEASKGALKDIHIRKERWGTGQPGEMSIFAKRPDRALNSLKGERLAKARRTLDGEGSESYYPLAKAICSDFRILMERIVETVFLADVVQRHRRAVTTLNKIGKLAKIATSDCELIDKMMTKYSRYEHSQSAESPIDVPDPEELEADITEMIEWHEEFSKRQVS